MHKERKRKKYFYFKTFLGGFHPSREIFTHMEKLALTVKGCKFGPIWTNARHSWPLRSVPHLRDIRL